MARPRKKALVSKAGEDVQFGPPWHCWKCGTEATGIRPWPVNALDPVDRFNQWAREHVFYLILPCKHHSRVARLADAITSLDYPTTRPEGMSDAEFRDHLYAITREALQKLAKSLPHGHVQTDPARQIVTQLMAGYYTPEFAIKQINSIIWPAKGEDK